MMPFLGKPDPRFQQGGAISNAAFGAMGQGGMNPGHSQPMPGPFQMPQGFPQMGQMPGQQFGGGPGAMPGFQPGGMGQQMRPGLFGGGWRERFQQAGQSPFQMGPYAR